MLACKGILTTPSIDTAVEERKSQRRLEILFYKILYMSIISYYSLNYKKNEQPVSVK